MRGVPRVLVRLSDLTGRCLSNNPTILFKIFDYFRLSNTNTSVLAF